MTFFKIRKITHNKKLVAAFLMVTVVSGVTGAFLSMPQPIGAQFSNMTTEPVQDLQSLLQPNDSIRYTGRHPTYPGTLPTGHELVLQALRGVLNDNGLASRNLVDGSEQFWTVDFTHPDQQTSNGYVYMEDYRKSRIFGGIALSWSGLVGDPIVGGAFIETRNAAGQTTEVKYVQEAFIPNQQSGQLAGGTDDILILRPPFHPNWWYTVYLWWWKWYWYWDWGWWWWDWWWQWYYWHWWGFWSSEPDWSLPVIIESPIT
jgi:hypothetical protein